MVESFRTSQPNPWVFTHTVFQIGNQLLGSAEEVPLTQGSCLDINVSLPVGTRIDFLWGVDSLPDNNLRFFINDSFQFQINGSLLEFIPEMQQRISHTAISKLTWCYVKGESSAGFIGADRGWVDQISFHTPAEAGLFPLDDKEMMCRILNLSTRDCALITSFSQSHTGEGTDGLSWAVTTSQVAVGAGAIRSPLSLPENGTSCLIAHTELPLNTLIRFSMRQEIGSEDRLFFATDQSQINLSARNFWQIQEHRIQITESSQLRWCISSGARRDTRRLVWLDNLSFQIPEYALSLHAPLRQYKLPGFYRTEIAVRDLSQPGALTPRLLVLPRSELDIGIIESIVSTQVFVTQAGENSEEIIATVTMQLFDLDASGEITLFLAGVDPVFLSQQSSSIVLTVAQQPRQILCQILDMSNERCQRITRIISDIDKSWSIDTSRGNIGGSSLRAPDNLAAGETACLGFIVVNLPENTQLQFAGFPGFSSDNRNHGHSLRLSAGDLNINYFPGSQDWENISIDLTTPPTLLSWCLGRSESSALLPAVHIDSLNFIFARYVIDSMAPVELPSALGNYRVSLVVRNTVNDDAISPQLRLTISTSTNIAAHSISVLRQGTAATFNIDVELVDQNSSASFTAIFSGAPQATLPLEEAIISLEIPPFSSAQLCQALDLSEADCARITDVSPPFYRWGVSNEPFQVGTSLLGSSASPPTGRTSCLTLEVSLAADSRVSFYWTIEPASGDRLQYFINDTQIAEITSPLPPNSGFSQRLEQRISPEEINRLSWCYVRGHSSSPNIVRGWLDQLILTTPQQAVRLPTDSTAALCHILDISDRDCQRITRFSQSHSGDFTTGLSWSINSPPMNLDGFAVRSPFSAPTNSESCLILEAELDSNIEIGFDYLTQLGPGDLLRFASEDMTLMDFSSELPYSWASHTRVLAADTSELSWCLVRSTQDQQPAAVWIDRLRITPPQYMIVISTPRTTSELGRYQTQLTISNIGNSSAVPSDLQLIISAGNNIRNAVSTTEHRGGELVFTLSVSLEDPNHSGSLVGQLLNLQPELIIMGSTVTLSFEPFPHDMICQALDMTDEDCQRISGFNTSTESPWGITTTTFQFGSDLLNSAEAPPLNTSSCLSLSVSLPAGSRIDFLWATDTTPTIDSNSIINNLRFNINSSLHTAILSSLFGSDGELQAQQRISSTEINELSWCFIKNETASSGRNQGWLDQLRFYPPEQATLLPVDNRVAMCRALGLNARDCLLVRRFAQTHTYNIPDSTTINETGLSWAITTEDSLSSGSSIRSPYSIQSSSDSCLILEVSLNPLTRITFHARNRVNEDSLSVREITGEPIDDPTFLFEQLSNASWQRYDFTVINSVENLTWCLHRIHHINRQQEILLDNISFTLLQSLSIREVMPLQPQLGTIHSQYYDIVVEDLTGRAPPPLELQISISNTANISNHLITSRFEDNLRIFTIAVALQNLNTSANLTATLSGVAESILSPVTSSRSVTLIIPPVPRQAVCSALSMNNSDCAQIVSFNTTADYPWEFTTASFQVGSSLLSSSRSSIPIGAQSCFEMTLAPLAANSRIDFLWAVDSAFSDALNFFVNDRLIARKSGSFASTEEEIQQRRINETITELRWCFQNNDDHTIENSNWLDMLSFHPPDQPLFPADDRQLLCDVLDINNRDCGLITAFTQTNTDRLDRQVEGLTWAVSTTRFYAGGNSLRSPLSLARGEGTCLRIETVLPPQTAVAFRIHRDVAFSGLFFSLLSFQSSSSFYLLHGAQSLETQLLAIFPQAEAEVSWCFSITEAIPNERVFWIDSLEFLIPQYSIIEESLLETRAELGFYRASVTVSEIVRGAAPRSAVRLFAFGESTDNTMGQSVIPEELGLTTSELFNIDSLTVTERTDGIFRHYFFDIQLTDITTTGTFLVTLSGVNDSYLSEGITTQRLSYGSFTPPELAALTLTAPATVMPSANGSFNFAVTVTATGTAGNPFDPEGLELRISAIDNAEATIFTYALSFADGLAHLTSVTASLRQQGIDGRLLLTVSHGDIQSQQTVTLRALPVLSTITITVGPATAVVSRRSDLVTVRVTVTPYYFSHIADTEALMLSITPSASGAMIGGERTLTLRNGEPVQTGITLSLGELDELTAVIGIANTSATLEATIVTASVSIRLVEELETLNIQTPSVINQSAADADFVFAITVSATGTAGNPFNPTGLELRVQGIDNAEVTIFSYGLSFSNGLARLTSVIASLRQQGIDGSLLLSVNQGGIQSRQTVVLQALPVLSTVTITANPAAAVVSRRSDEVIVQVTVIPDYVEHIADTEVLMLSITPSASGAIIDGQRTLNLHNGAAIQTSITVSLGTLDDLSAVIGIANTAANVVTASVSIRLVEELEALTIDAPSIITQSAADAEFDFALTVNATGTAGNPFNPTGLQLQVQDNGNAEVRVLSYALSFSNGQANVNPVTAALRQQGLDGSLLLSVSHGDIQAQQMVMLRALPVLSTVTITVNPTVAAVARYSETVIFQATVTPHYVQHIADTEVLMLSVTPSTSGAIIDGERTLTLHNGEAIQTDITLSLGELDELTAVIGIADTVATVVTASISVRLVEELDSLTIHAPPVIDQSAGNADFVFAVTVSATGTTGNPFNPTGLELRVQGIDNAEIRIFSYALDFTDGIAQVNAVTVALQQQGINGRILVGASQGRVYKWQTITLNAQPALSTVTITVNPAVAVVTRRNDLVTFQVTVTPEYAEQMADAEVLMLSVIPSASGATIDGERTLTLRNGRAIQTSITLSLGELDELSAVFGIADTVATVVTASISIRLVEELDTLNIQALSVIDQSAADADFVFAITVSATGTAGNPFDPTGLELQVQAVDNAEVAIFTYALSFTNGLAHLTSVIASLQQQGIDGSLLLSVNHGDIHSQQTITLSAQPVLSTVSITVNPDAAVVARRSDEVTVEVTVTPEYVGQPADTEVLMLSITPSASGATIDGNRTLTLRNGRAIQTSLTLSLGELDELSTVFGIVDTVATVVTASISIRLVEELETLNIQTPSVIEQSAADADFVFAITVSATGTAGNPFDPTGLELRVSAVDNAEVTIFTYALSFTDGLAHLASVTASLQQQGIDGSLLLSVNHGDIHSQQMITLRSLPVLSTVTIRVNPDAAVVARHSDVVTVLVTVTPDYIGQPADTEVLMLSITPSASGATIDGNRTLTLRNGAAIQTSITLSLGELDELTAVIGIANTSATLEATIVTASVSIRLVEQLDSLTLQAPSVIDQGAADADFVFAVTVSATGTAGNPFDPTGLELRVSAIDNAEVTIFTYALSFTNGLAHLASVTASLQQQGIDGSLLLSLNHGDIHSQQMITLRSLPVLSTVTIRVNPDAAVVARRSDVVTVLVTVTPDYIGQPADTEVLMLSITPSASGATIDGNRTLTLLNGAAIQTNITLTLGELDELSAVIDIADTVAAVLTASINIQLVEQLDSLTLQAPSVIDQGAADADFVFAITVSATGTAGNPFDPTGLELQVSAIDNAEVTIFTYALSFTDGLAHLASVTASLQQQGIDGSLLLSVSQGEIQNQQMVTLSAQPVLSTVTITVNPDAAVVARRSDMVTMRVTVTPEYVGQAADTEMLTLSITPSASGATIDGNRTLTLRNARAIQTSITISLGELDELTAVIGIADTVATVVTASISIRLVEELDTLNIQAPSVIDQSAADADFVFAITVSATGTADNPFDPTGLELRVSAIDNAEVTIFTYALSFTNGLAHLTSVIASLQQQGRDGSLLLTLSQDDIHTRQTVVLQALPVLSTVTIRVNPDAAVVTRHSDVVTVLVTVTPDYIGQPADTEMLTLSITPSASGAIIDGNRTLTLRNARAIQTSITISLGELDELSAVFGIADTVATVVTASISIRLVEELETLTLQAPSVIDQSAVDADFVFAITVSATSTAGNPFNPTGLQVQVQDSGNAEVSISTYSLTFSNGLARLTSVTASLQQQGIDGSLLLSVSYGDIQSQQTVILRPLLRVLPVLSTVTITAEPSVAVVARRSDVVTVLVTVTPDYVGQAADTEVLMLSVTPSASGAMISENQILTLRNGVAIQTNITISPGELDELTAVIDIADTSATVVVASISIRLVEELETLTLQAPSVIDQSAADADFVFAITVSATGTADNPFDPTGLELQVQTIDNAEVSISTYALTFTGGLARLTSVTASLQQQGRDGSLLLSVSQGGIQNQKTITLSAQPVLSTVTITVDPAATVVTRRSDVVSFQVTVTPGYIGRPANSETLILRILPASLNTNPISAVVSSAQTLTLQSGRAIQTSITISLGELDELITVLGITDTEATIVTASVSVRLIEELEILTIHAPPVIDQSAVNADFVFAITVSATGTAGNPFDPTGLELQVQAIDNAEVSISTYVLTFTGGLAHLTSVMAELQQQGRNGSLLLSVSQGDIQSRQTITLSALPVLSTVTIAVDPAVAGVARRSDIVTIQVTVTPDYIGQAADTEMLMLSITPSIQGATVDGNRILTLRNGAGIQTSITISLGELDELTTVISITDTEATVVTASVSIQLVEELETLIINVTPTITQSAVNTDLIFDVTVNATGTAGGPVNPSGLELRVQAISNAEVTFSNYMLSFTDGQARLSPVTATLRQQGRDGILLLSVSHGSLHIQKVVTLSALPVLRNITIAANPAATIVARRNEAVTIFITVIPDYVDRIASTEVLMLSVFPSAAGATISGNRLLTLQNGTPLETHITISLGELDELTAVFDIADTAATVATASISIELSEQLDNLVMNVSPIISQSAAAADFNFAVTVSATGTVGTPFNPTGLELQVSAINNTTVPVSNYALSFTNGVARLNPVSASLLQQGIDGSLLLSIDHESLRVQQLITLRALPVLSVVTVVVNPPVAVVANRSDLVTIRVMVTPDYVGQAADSETLTLRIIPAFPDAINTMPVSEQILTLRNGATIQTSFTLSLGELDELTAIFDITDTSATVVRGNVSIRLLEELDRLTINAPQAITQNAVDTDFNFAVTVSAINTAGNRFDPTGLELQVSAIDNAEVPISTYTLNFIDGMARLHQVTASLQQQGRSGILLLSISHGTHRQQLIRLNALPVLSAVTIVANPAAVVVASRNDPVTIAVTVTPDYAGLIAPVETLTLRIIPTSPDAANTVISSDQTLTLRNGAATQTSITLSLGELDELTAILDITDTSATVVRARVNVQLVEVLDRLVINATPVITQSEADADFNFAVTVSAINTAGNRFDSIGEVELRVMPISNATVPISTYALSFTNGQAYLNSVSASLIQQGRDGILLLSLNHETHTQQLIRLNALPVLSAVTITANPATVEVERRSAAVTVQVAVIPNYIGQVADSEMLTLRILPASPGAANALFSSDQLLTLQGGSAVQTSITISLGSLDEVTAILDITDTSATVVRASVSVQLVEMLDRLTLNVPSIINQQTADADFVFAVTVSATGTAGNPFDPTGLELQVQNIGNTTVPISTYALTFADGLARLTSVTASLQQQGRDGSLLLSVSHGDIQNRQTITLSALPALSTITITVNPAAAVVARRSDMVTIRVTVTPDYVGETADTEMLMLSVTPSTRGATISEDRILTFRNGAAIQTSITLSLGELDELTAVIGIADTSATVTVASISVQLVEELETLTLHAPLVINQQTADADFVFAVTVSATGTVSNSFDPTGLELQVQNIGNATVPISTYALTFAGGLARLTSVTASLQQQGRDGSLLLSVSHDDIQSRQTITLSALPVLSTITITVNPAAAVVARRSDIVSIQVTVTPDYVEEAADTEMLMLSITPSASGATISEDQILTLRNGAAIQTSITLSLGELDELTAVVGIADTSATVTVASISVQLVEELETLTLHAPPVINQQTANADFVFAITVSATGTAGNPFDPTGLELQVQNIGNATVPISTYALTFAGGLARLTSVTASLQQQGRDGSLLLTLSQDSIHTRQTITLSALPALSTITITVNPAAAVVARRSDIVSIQVTVTPDYVGEAADTEMLMLSITPSASGATISEDQILTLRNGAAIQTSITLSLGELDELTAVIGIADTSATVAAASVSARLVEELETLTLHVPPVINQQTADADFVFAITVSATGTAGSPFDPTGLELQVSAINNAEVSISTYALSFTNGLAHLTSVIASLQQQGRDGRLLLSIRQGGIQSRQTVVLQALPVLSTITITVNPTVAVVSRRNDEVIVQVTVTPDYVGEAADTEMLMLSITPSASGATISEDQILTLRNGAAIQTSITLSLGELDGLTAILDIEDTAATVVTASVSVRLIEELDRLVIDAPAQIIQSDAGADFSFDVTVSAIGSIDNPFNPGELELRLQATSNVEVTISTYVLSFTDGIARLTSLTVSLQQQGSDGIMQLTVNHEDIHIQQPVILIAQPILRGITIGANPTAINVARRSDVVTVFVTVIPDYAGRRADFEVLTLQVIPSTNGATVSKNQILTLQNGTAVQTSITISLGELDELTVMLGIEDTAVTVETASISVQLVEELDRLSINAPQQITQSDADADFVFAITVSATGTVGNPFNPTGLELQVQAINNAEVTTSVYTLRFTEGLARLPSVTATLLQRGINGALRLTITSQGRQLSRTVLLNATEVLQRVHVQVISFELTRPSFNRSITISTILIEATGSKNNPVPVQDLFLHIELISGVVESVTPALDIPHRFSIGDSGEVSTQVSVALSRENIAARLRITVSGHGDAELIPANLSLSREIVLTHLSVSLNPNILERLSDTDRLESQVIVTAIGSDARPYIPQGISLRHRVITGSAMLTITPTELSFNSQGIALATVTITASTGEAVIGIIPQTSLFNNNQVQIGEGLLSITEVELPIVPDLVVVRLQRENREFFQSDPDTPVSFYIEVVAFNSAGRSVPIDGVQLISKFEYADGLVIDTTSDLTILQSGLILQVAVPAHDNVISTITIQVGNLPNEVISRGLQIQVSVQSVSLDLTENDTVNQTDIIGVQRWLLIQQRLREQLRGMDIPPLSEEDMATIEQLQSSTSNLDVNSDGIITEIDIQILFRNIIGFDGATGDAGDTQETAESLQLDINNDGRIDGDDYAILMRWLSYERARQEIADNLEGISLSLLQDSNLSRLFFENPNYIDVNNDGSANSLDLRILLRYKAGLRGAGLGTSISIPQVRALLGSEQFYELEPVD